MRRIFGLGVVLLAGCSTAPVAGLMDCVFPSKAEGRPSKPGPRRERDELRDGPDWNKIPPPNLGELGRAESLPAPVGLDEPVRPTSRRDEK